MARLDRATQPPRVCAASNVFTCVDGRKLDDSLNGGHEKNGRDKARPFHVASGSSRQLHPLVPPHVSHFKHVPFRTKVKLPQDSHASP